MCVCVGVHVGARARPCVCVRVGVRAFLRENRTGAAD